MTDSKTTDVLIIGAGAAGLSAAVAAHDSGANAAIIEKGGKLGGTACAPRKVETTSRSGRAAAIPRAVAQSDCDPPPPTVTLRNHAR